MHPGVNKESYAHVGRVLEESAERREKPDNLELLEPLEDEEGLEMMDPKETLYDTHNDIHTHAQTSINS